MHILTKCPGCHQQMELNIGSLDRRLRCPVCGRLFRMPDAKQLEKALRVAREASGTVFVDEDGRIYG